MFIFYYVCHLRLRWFLSTCMSFMKTTSYCQMLPVIFFADSWMVTDYQANLRLNNCSTCTRGAVLAKCDSLLISIVKKRQGQRFYWLIFYFRQEVLQLAFLIWMEVSLWRWHESIINCILDPWRISIQLVSSISI